MPPDFRALVRKNIGELPVKVNTITQNMIEVRATRILETKYGNDEVPVGLILNAINDAAADILTGSLPNQSGTI